MHRGLSLLHAVTGVLSRIKDGAGTALGWGPKWVKVLNKIVIFVAAVAVIWQVIIPLISQIDSSSPSITIANEVRNEYSRDDYGPMAFATAGQRLFFRLSLQRSAEAVADSIVVRVVWPSFRDDRFTIKSFVDAGGERYYSDAEVILLDRELCLDYVPESSRLYVPSDSLTFRISDGVLPTRLRGVSPVMTAAGLDISDYFVEYKTQEVWITFEAVPLSRTPECPLE